MFSTFVMQVSHLLFDVTRSATPQIKESLPPCSNMSNGSLSTQTLPALC